MSDQLMLFDADEVEDALPKRALAMLADHGRKPGIDCVNCIRFLLSNKTRRYVCELYGDDGTLATEWRGFWPACGRWEVRT